MKKLNVLFAAAVIAVTVTGCGSAPAQTSAPVPVQAPATAPEWADEIPPEDAFWGIGIAKLQN